MSKRLIVLALFAIFALATIPSLAQDSSVEIIEVRNDGDIDEVVVIQVNATISVSREINGIDLSPSGIVVPGQYLVYTQDLSTVPSGVFELSQPSPMFSPGDIVEFSVGGNVVDSYQIPTPPPGPCHVWDQMDNYVEVPITWVDPLTGLTCVGDDVWLPSGTATSAEESNLCVVADTWLSIRVDPNPGSREIARVAPGTELHYLGLTQIDTDRDAYNVRFDSHVGYVTRTDKLTLRSCRGEHLVATELTATTTTTAATSTTATTAANGDFGSCEVYTQGPVTSVITIQSGQLGAVWWQVPGHSNTTGLWIQTPGQYNYSGAGRVRIWDTTCVQNVGTVDSFKNWWETIVQNEADQAGVGNYTWYNR